MPLTCRNVGDLSSSERTKAQSDTSPDLHLSLIRLFRQCGHWHGDAGRYCLAAEGIRAYLVGARCKIHTPARIAGNPEPPGSPTPVTRRKTTR